MSILILISILAMGCMIVGAAPTQYSTMNDGAPYYTLFGKVPAIPHHEQHEQNFLFSNIHAISENNGFFQHKLFIQMDFDGSDADYGKYSLTLLPLTRPTVHILNHYLDTATKNIDFFTVYKTEAEGRKKIDRNELKAERLLAQLESAGTLQQTVSFRITQSGSIKIPIKLPKFLMDPSMQMLAVIVTRGDDVVGFTEGIALDPIYQFAIQKRKISVNEIANPQPSMVRFTENADSFKIYVNLAPWGASPNPHINTLPKKMEGNHVEFPWQQTSGFYSEYKIDLNVENDGEKDTLIVRVTGGLKSSPFKLTSEGPFKWGNIFNLLESVKQETEIKLSADKGVICLTIDKDTTGINERYWFEV